MSSADIAAKLVKSISIDEIKVLTLLDEYLKRFEVFPLETLSDLSGFSMKYLYKIISSLLEKKLVHMTKVPYEGTTLLTAGLDLLALYCLTNRDAIEFFGREIGVGKESDVYDGIKAGGERVSIKFYRIGRTSFRDTARKRPYVSPESSVPWLLRSEQAAKREFEALEKLSAYMVSVPKPIARERHVVVMDFLEGEIVAYAKAVYNAEGILRDTLDIVKKAYDCGFINGDLSAFNIFVTVDGRVVIIDWPQALSSKRRSAQKRLLRDVKNVCNYFKKKFSLQVDYEEEYRSILD